MTDPGPPKGWAGLPTWCGQFYRYVISRLPLAGIGLTPNQTDGGTMFSTTPGGVAASPVIIDFQLSDMSNQTDGTQVGIYGGTVYDINGSQLLTPTALVLGAYTAFSVSTGDTVAYLIVTYTQSTNGPVTSITVDTDASLPSNTSGTFYIPLGNFTVNTASVTITTSPIGDQVFASGRNWYSSPDEYSGLSGGA